MGEKVRGGGAGVEKMKKPPRRRVAGEAVGMCEVGLFRGSFTALTAFAARACFALLAAFTAFGAITTLSAFTAGALATHEGCERVVAFAIDHGAAFVAIELAISVGIVFREHLLAYCLMGGFAFFFVEPAIAVRVEALEDLRMAGLAAFAQDALHFGTFFAGKPAVTVFVEFLKDGGGERPGFTLRAPGVWFGLLGHGGAAGEHGGEKQVSGFHGGMVFGVWVGVPGPAVG